MTHPRLADRRHLPIDRAYAECARIARREARNFYYAFLPLRRARRHALYAVYAFARLADDLADDEGRSLPERSAALEELEVRLDRTLSGEPSGAVFVALEDAVRKYDIPPRALRDLLTGVRRDQSVTRFATWEDLCDYCYHVAGTIGLVCAAVFGASGEEAERFAVAQGQGMQLVNIMRDVEEDLAFGRIYLPQDLLDQYGVTEEALRQGRTDGAFIALMTDLAGRARNALEEGGRLLPLVAPDARICPALLRELYEAILVRIEASGFDVFNTDPDLGFYHKVRLMTSAWWRFRIKP